MVRDNVSQELSNQDADLIHEQVFRQLHIWNNYGDRRLCAEILFWIQEPLPRNLGEHKPKARVLMLHGVLTLSQFVIQYFFIVCAPVALTAAIYACLYKMARWASTATLSGIGAKWRRPRWILWTFIVADVVTTGLQVAGAALIGVAESDGKDSSNANNILLAGLAVQTFSFCGYFVVFGLFLRELSRDRSLRLAKSFKIFVAALLLASLLILLRTVFRLAETAEGVYGYLMTHEAYFGALEFAPVVIAALILAIFHPGRLISPGKLAVEEHTAEKDAEVIRSTSPETSRN